MRREISFVLARLKASRSAKASVYGESARRRGLDLARCRAYLLHLAKALEGLRVVRLIESASIGTLSFALVI
jgi:hypothetical protein